MLFSFLKCPECGTPHFSPDFDLTIEEYMSVEYNNGHMLVVLTEDPPKRPDYLIFKCQRRECGHTEKYSETEVIKRIIDEWSKLAWVKSQKEVKSAVNVEEYFTKHIIDKDLHKVISPKDLKNNPLLRDYIKAIEDAEAKRTKKSNS